LSFLLPFPPVKNTDGKIIGASKIARDITEQKRAQDLIATLAREAEHRSKNMLANVQAAVNLSQSPTTEGLKQAIEGRIQALANVHSLFVETRWIGAELSAIATQELAPYSAKDASRLHMEGLPIMLEPNTAQAVAVALHELATNAGKYGSLSGSKGYVELTWLHGADGLLVLRWTEKDGPVVRKPTHQGFGTRVIERMVGQLKGKADFNWRPDGLVCEITVQT
jgi:two-component sensor histidine kinase